MGKFLNVTVCELPDDPEKFQNIWDGLAGHVKQNKSEIVLLPEMPFSPWFALRDDFTTEQWERAVVDHDSWLDYAADLFPAAIVGSRPVDRNSMRLNEGFILDEEQGYQPIHHKSFLPNENGFWEASWYDRGDGNFRPVQIGEASAGFQICTELWSMDTARKLGESGVHLIVNPRATEAATNDKWLTGGRTASLVSGAYCLSSNRSGSPGDDVHFGGMGWITGPDGEVLATTSANQPFASIIIDLETAETAKTTYPRYAINHPRF